MRELTITMRHPVAALRPNGGRAHWSVVARAKKQARGNAKLLALHALGRDGLDGFRPCRYRVVWYFHMGPPPDHDNVIASLKSALDGCADAFKVNDRAWTLEGVEPVRNAARSGYLELIFTEEIF